MDPAKIGEYLVTVALISRNLGHAHMGDTVRDYLLPHVHLRQHSPEQLFVLRALAGVQPVTEEEAIELARAMDLPPRGSLAGRADRVSGAESLD